MLSHCFYNPSSHVLKKNIFVGEYSGQPSGYSLETSMITHFKIKVLYAVCFLAVSVVKAKMLSTLVVHFTGCQ